MENNEMASPEMIAEFKAKMTAHMNENLEFVEMRARFERASAEIVCAQRDSLRAQLDMPTLEGMLYARKEPSPIEKVPAGLEIVKN